MPQPDNSRRQFLRLSYTVGMGVALPGWLTACGDGNEPIVPDIAETFTEPDRLVARNGVLDVQMHIAYADNVLDGRPVHLRSIEGRLTGPTLDIHAGDTLSVLVHNNLPPNPASVEPNWVFNYPNSTNLHTHGLHADPRIVRPGVYGDYVVDDPREGIAPGGTRQHEFAIGKDHPPGTYWYHPHLHGSSAVQVSSGMAGALIVRGPADQVPEIAAARERLFLFQTPDLNDNGEIPDFASLVKTKIATVYYINGLRRPRLLMRPGEVQRWRFINATVGNFLNLSLDSHGLMQIGHDGNPVQFPRTIAAGLPESLVMAPGNRDDILIKAGAPGTYYLRSLAYDMGADKLPEDIVAEIVVTGEPLTMALPAGPLPMPHMLAPITDEELASHGGLKRELVFRIVKNDNGDPITAAPAAALLPVPAGELSLWTFQTGNTFVANTVYAMGSATGVPSTTPQMPTVYYPFQSSRAIKQTVALDSVEEWTVYSMDRGQHPMHIHVNPVQVIKINGRPVEPFWADTIALPRGGSPEAPVSITLRSRFTDFKGPFVMHCHLLLHEDLGMMQRIEVV
ncbi:multicopper oxidase family protein [Eoetvoesiella caeni]|uniref:FtsP/CotA-like multicopper oxidase with cupredoxin domain n=1 Tax=Eoetvoesiella caeni TaxID=645616 RepID=A0A366H824_9BURK|nr:multicopper oxidase domain-containing protein [Eoetvoesiella caeni]MCI2810166.1 multicopper oxidase domain-containing protein [Eoetvoesiella caeni]NYT56482.1 multicopper oxidase domain-containing protein [Eoetvoesiella caeni]RBP37918.1 FtsP/CotA-like multicopper oxidase with cupredoxin domain [Eoetvoesiella caeni]